MTDFEASQALMREVAEFVRANPTAAREAAERLRVELSIEAREKAAKDRGDRLDIDPRLIEVYPYWWLDMVASRRLLAEPWPRSGRPTSIEAWDVLIVMWVLTHPNESEIAAIGLGCITHRESPDGRGHTERGNKGPLAEAVRSGVGEHATKCWARTRVALAERRFVAQQSAEADPVPLKTAIAVVDDTTPTTLPTARDLASEAGISDDTFRRVREAARIRVKLRGAAARNRRYTPAEVDLLIAAVFAGNFIERSGMAEKWAKWGTQKAP